MSPTTVAVSGINTAIAVSAGQSHTFALLEDKTVKCWGTTLKYNTEMVWEPPVLHQ